MDEGVAAALHVNLYSERRLPRFDDEAALYVGNRKRRSGYGMSAPDKTNDTVGVSAVENVAVFHILHGDVNIFQHIAI